MKTIKNLKPSELNLQTVALAKKEQQASADFLLHLAEVERRRTYLESGSPNLFSFLVKSCGYSDAEASVRMRAARLLLAVPEVKTDLESGALNMTQLARVQSVIKNEEKACGLKVERETKKQVVEMVKNLNQKQTDSVLATHFEKGFEKFSQKKVFETPKGENEIEILLRVPHEFAQELEDLKSIYSHVAPGADLLEVLKLMVRDVKKQKGFGTQQKEKSQSQEEPLQKPEFNQDPRPKTATAQSNVAPLGVCGNQKAIPRATKRLVFQRDQGKCQHKNHLGESCGSTFQLQFDHITPRFAGGTNEAHNLQLLCGQHNRARYETQTRLRRK